MVAISLRAEVVVSRAVVANGKILRSGFRWDRPGHWAVRWRRVEIEAHDGASNYLARPRIALEEPSEAEAETAARFMPGPSIANRILGADGRGMTVRPMCRKASISIWTDFDRSEVESKPVVARRWWFRQPFHRTLLAVGLVDQPPARCPFPTASCCRSVVGGSCRRVAAWIRRPVPFTMPARCTIEICDWLEQSGTVLSRSDRCADCRSAGRQVRELGHHLLRQEPDRFAPGPGLPLCGSRTAAASRPPTSSCIRSIFSTTVAGEPSASRAARIPASRRCRRTSGGVFQRMTPTSSTGAGCSRIIGPIMPSDRQPPGRLVGIGDTGAPAAIVRAAVRPVRRAPFLDRKFPVARDIGRVEVKLIGRKPRSPASFKVSEPLLTPATPIGGYGFCSGLMCGRRVRSIRSVLVTFQYLPVDRTAPPRSTA